MITFVYLRLKHIILVHSYDLIGIFETHLDSTADEIELAINTHTLNDHFVNQCNTIDTGNKNPTSYSPYSFSIDSCHYF